MEYSFQNLKNTIDFFLRQKFVFSRKNYFEKNEDKEGLLATPKALERENFLVETYNLEFLNSNSTRQNYTENLYLIDLLDTYLKPNHVNDLRILDIGCKNWFYAKSEHAFFKKYCGNLTLDGIELDANRLYSNFYSRKEVAKFYIKGLENTNYIEGNFLNHNEKYDYIVWILPFVVEEPLLKWGLPLKHFQPEKMLEHAYESLKDGGQIFIINQGEAEYDVQKELCEKLSIKFNPLVEIQSDFLEYQIPRFGILIKK